MSSAFGTPPAADPSLELLDAIPDPVLLVGPDGLVAWANPAAGLLFAYPPGGLVGEAAADLLPPGWEEEGSRSGQVVSQACVEIAVLVRTREVRRHGRPHRLVTLRDLDETRALERQLVSAQRLETVGVLATGVAAEFSNILTVILGNTALARQALGPDHALAEDLATVTREAERAARVVRQLLAFSRRGRGQPRRLSVGELLTDMVGFFGHVFGGAIQLRADVPPALPHIMADPALIEQAVTNACVGAREAMPRGGTLTLSARRVFLGAAEAAARGVRPGSHLEILVADNGAVPTADDRRGGSPRPRELGLAAVRRIVRDQGGAVEVEHEQGRGTTVVMLLRAMDEVPEEEAPTLYDIHLARRETVLLAEDEHSVRRLMTEVLREAGYTVVPAADGAEARALFEAEPERFEGAIIDVGMPHLSGRELRETIGRRRPDLPVLWVSGEASPDLAEEARTDFLAKPFTPGELGERLRALLDRTALAPS